MSRSTAAKSTPCATPPTTTLNPSWWFDLLHDPRGRVPNGPGYWQTLAARRDAVLKMSCHKCLRHQSRGDLLQRYGGDKRVKDVALDLTP